MRTRASKPSILGAALAEYQVTGDRAAAGDTGTSPGTKGRP